MTKEDWKRLALHLPWGIIAAFLGAWRADVGITSVALMVGYEGFNDWRQQDKSYKDVLGIVWGYLLGNATIWRLLT